MQRSPSGPVSFNILSGLDWGSGFLWGYISDSFYHIEKTAQTASESVHPRDTEGNLTYIPDLPQTILVYFVHLLSQIYSVEHTSIH